VDTPSRRHIISCPLTKPRQNPDTTPTKTGQNPDKTPAVSLLSNDSTHTMSNTFLTSLEDHPPERVAACIRQRLPEIETALARGFTHRQILQQLHLEGIVLTEAYYRRLITRLRQEVRSHQSMPDTPAAQEGSGRPAPAQVEKETEAAIPAPSKRGPVAKKEVPQPNEPDSALPSANERDLSGAIAPSPASPVAIMNKEQTGPKPFRWSAKEFLAKDWENF